MASEFLTIAKQVLQNSNKPMRPIDIVSEGIRLGLFSDSRAGKTPHQTMKSKLSVDVRKFGERSDFVRTGPGLFFLRQLLSADHSEFSARPIKKPPSKERVLVFDSHWFPREDRFQGINKRYTRLCRRLLRRKVCEYLPRLEAEQTCEYKQVLTYIMVTRKGTILAYKRGQYNRVEDFLRGSLCVGFGGHVTQEDLSLFTTSGMGVYEACSRELQEELKLPSADIRRLQDAEGLSLVGVLNDDSSEVGERHIAILFSYEVSEDSAWNSPKRGEKAITQLHWLLPSDPPPPIWEFEYWSQLCLRSYFPNLVKAAPAYRVRRKRVFASPHLLCVLGSVGSGKSETTKILRDEFGYIELNTGRILAKILNIPPVPDTPREVFQRKAWTFINSENGPVELAKNILASIPKLGNQPILIDGLRQRATLDAIEQMVQGRRLAKLFVHTTPDLAYAFYQSRERKNVSFSDFLAIKAAPVESEVDALIGIADAVLYNWTGRRQLQRTIRGMMSELLNSQRGSP